MKRFISSKLIVALVCSLAMLSFVSAQQSSTTTSNDKRSRLRGFNEERHHVLWDVIEEENRGLKKGKKSGKSKKSGKDKRKPGKATINAPANKAPAIKPLAKASAKAPAKALPARSSREFSAPTLSCPISEISGQSVYFRIFTKDCMKLDLFPGGTLTLSSNPVTCNEHAIFGKHALSAFQSSSGNTITYAAVGPNGYSGTVTIVLVPGVTGVETKAEIKYNLQTFHLEVRYESC